MNCSQFIWPLAFMLVALVCVRQFFQDVRPIFVNVVKGVATQAQSNAAAYALAIGFGLSASLATLADQATALDWPYVAAFAKVIQPFVAGCVAYATQNKFVAPKPPENPSP